MELRPGFKRTDIGQVPVEWEVRPLSSVAETSSGTTPARALFDRYYANGTTAWVKTLDLNNSVLTATDESVTGEALLETSLRVYPRGTVLVAMYGGFNQIGRTGLLDIPAAVNQALTAIRPDSDVLDSRYLLEVLNLRVDHWKNVASSSRKDANITGSDVRAFELALPPVAEQRAIAAALSDVDALLGALERLIAKKRDLKQATMQQLLTGQTRLPGFTGKWETKRLSELSRITIGRTPSRAVGRYWGRGHTWLSIADVRGKVIHGSAEEITEAGAASMTIVPRGTLLMTFKLSVGRLCFAGRDLYTNEAICALHEPQAEPEFLYYALGRVDFSLYGKQAVKGVTLNSESLSLIMLRLPGRDEQTAIAAVLSDMDAELTALEARRDKTRLLKQGMMQELLTGRTRLV